jgi:hypothetical protein
MYKVKLTLTDNTPLTIYFAGTLSVVSYKDKDTEKLEIRVMDGNHNNGGWSVKESYDDVIKLIDNAIDFKKIF